MAHFVKSNLPTGGNVLTPMNEFVVRRDEDQQEYKDGMVAAIHGHTVDVCKYLEGTESYRLWHAGYEFILSEDKCN